MFKNYHLDFTGPTNQLLLSSTDSIDSVKSRLVDLIKSVIVKHGIKYSIVLKYDMIRKDVKDDKEVTEQREVHIRSETRTVVNKDEVEESIYTEHAIARTN